MNLALLAPMALASLVALLVPLLIHLSRRNELHAVQFAALRWLRAGQRPRRNLRVEDWPLLLLRLLLLTLLALWLARPVLQGATDHTPYVAVMPGITTETVKAQELPADARLHWLAEGFASLDQMPPGPQPLTSLLRQLDADLPQGGPLTVLATARFDGADAGHLLLSRPVDWRILDVDPPAVPATPAPQPPLLRIHADEAHLESARYLRAAAKALQTGTADPLSGVVPDNTGDVLVWLASGTPPETVLQWIERGGTALLAQDATPADTTTSAEDWSSVWRDEAGQTLLQVRPSGEGRMLRFTLPLLPQTMPMLLDAQFPQRLRDLLQTHPAAPARADARSSVPRVGATGQRPPAQDLRAWLTLLIAVAFLIERWMATRSRRASS